MEVFKSASEIQEDLERKIPHHPVYEPKKNDLTGTESSSARYLNEKYNELQNVLDHSRLLKYSRVSVGEFQAFKHRILVKQKVGKWDNFGYMDSKNLFLKPHEALYLLEMKRLLIFKEEICMTLEDCYSLFLTKEKGIELLTLKEYLVYSTISRNGFSVKFYQPRSENLKRKLSDYTSLVWNRLDELLNRPTSSLIVNEEMYEQVKADMDKNHSAFRVPQKIIDLKEEPLASQKRKASPADRVDAVKKFKSSASSLLDGLTEEPDYKRFETVFSQINVNILAMEPCDRESSEFRFRFDVFNPKENKNAKKTTLPNYRVIVADDGTMPDRNDLVYLQENDVHDCPILVVVVDESLSLNAYLYSFR